MLGKTAGGLYWMFRYLERSENTARLFEAGYRMALTRSASAEDEWASVITTVGVREEYLARHDNFDAPSVVNFLLRDKTNPSSVLSAVEAARNNARLVRTALTREVWQAVNESWITLKAMLARPVREADLPNVLSTIRQQTSLVRGALHGTMLRNDIYNFARLGTFIERADSTARILDVKYYVLLPSVSYVGSSLDNVQWEALLRSASAESAFSWLNENEDDAIPAAIIKFLILDRRMPRSLTFSSEKLMRNLQYLAEDYGAQSESYDIALETLKLLKSQSTDTILESGLHEFLEDYIGRTNTLSAQIEKDFRFYG